jgi:hypothetical protein
MTDGCSITRIDPVVNSCAATLVMALHGCLLVLLLNVSHLVLSVQVVVCVNAYLRLRSVLFIHGILGSDGAVV